MTATTARVRTLPMAPGVRGHLIEVELELGTAALSRLLGELHRRRVHVEDLRYAEQVGAAALTLTVLTDRAGADLLGRRLDRLVDVLAVRPLTLAAPAAV